MGFCYRYIIHGKLVSKKNSHRVRYRGQKTYIGNSSEYLQWAESAIFELKCQRGQVATIPKPQRVRVDAVAYLAKRQRAFDEDNLCGGIFDTMQSAGIVENDSQFKIGDIEQPRDRENPRVEIWLRPCT